MWLLVYWCFEIGDRKGTVYNIQDTFLEGDTRGVPSKETKQYIVIEKGYRDVMSWNVHCDAL